MKKLKKTGIKAKITVGVILTIFALSLVVLPPNNTKAIDPFFTLVAKTGDSVGADYLNFVRQHCARIGINLDVQVLDWPSFVGELIAFRDFDLCCVGLSGGGADPDFSGVYDENGSLNLFGYDTSMDWDEDLGTGINEWYMKQGTLIMPPDSEERVQHYWAWEQYLMDKICPMKVLYSPRAYVTHWSNLVGYNYSDGLYQSWGKMYWDGAHTGQVSTNEFVISNDPWSDLNPLFQDDAASSQVSNAVLDTLIFYDADLTVWPHLATGWIHINETYLRINIREGVKWQDDPGGLFLDEYLDVDDVYFSLYAWKTVSNDQHLYAWIEELVKVDQYTLDLFIDGDPSTPENEPYAPYLPSLSLNILPEHYLNQSQLADGVTPDISHPSWSVYTTDAFGTGILQMDDFVEGVETTLKPFEDCWLRDPLVNSDPALDVENRFGTTYGIDYLRIRVIPDAQTALLEYEAGKTDLEGVTAFPSRRDQFQADPDHTIQNDLIFFFNFIGYNMREVRPHIGSRALAPGDPSMTVGLAVRKAINYAIDRQEINNVEHAGEYSISDHPIHSKMGIWCNPNIIRYNHDIDKAREFMTKAGYDLGWTAETPGFTIGIALTAFISTIAIAAVVYRKKK